jgi:hypothetical protein
VIKNLLVRHIISSSCYYLFPPETAEMARTSGVYRATNLTDTEIAANGDVDRDPTQKFPLELEDGSLSDEEHDEFTDEDGSAGKWDNTFSHPRFARFS